MATVLGVKQKHVIAAINRPIITPPIPVLPTYCCHTAKSYDSQIKVQK